MEFLSTHMKNAIAINIAIGCMNIVGQANASVKLSGSPDTSAAKTKKLNGSPDSSVAKNQAMRNITDVLTDSQNVDFQTGQLSSEKK